MKAGSLRTRTAARRIDRSLRWLDEADEPTRRAAYDAALDAADDAPAAADEEPTAAR